MSIEEKKTILEKLGYFDMGERHTHGWNAPNDYPINIPASDNEEQALEYAWEYYLWVQTVRIVKDD